MLRSRARMLGQIRRFFHDREVLEVETPLLGRGAGPDPHIASIQVPDIRRGAGGTDSYYLQSSPELAMKRLLAAGSGPIYQICKAFRGEEVGRLHNPEFTILEWYRPGFGVSELMDEVEALMSELLGLGPALRIDYAGAFRRWADVEVDGASLERLRECAAELAPAGNAMEALDRDGYLDLILAGLVQPNMSRGPVFVYDYPESQAALARVRPGARPRAERFELFLDGIELANGFHELQGVLEQRRRFAAELGKRAERGLPEVALDERFLAALEAGLPDCSGVALGLDRTLMIAAGRRSLGEVIAFPVDRA